VATDFFQQQDLARRNSSLLVVYFTLAVVAIVALLYALAVAVVGYRGSDPMTGAAVWDLAWWSPELLLQVGLLTLLVVGGGSLFKMAQLRGGGRAVAESLGGRRLHPDSRNPSERVLLNVVEEMAIASGTATPPVYLLAEEDGINAFAAGFTPGDAVIGVTRGCVEALTRDQLQGVIAHEFSHILNGDMRLNIRLIGVVHGILIIGIIGYYLLRSAAFSGHRSRGGNRGNNAAPLLAVGLGLMAIGFIGTFFGNWIKASVSRQREFLADASAVQYTRNPDGIAGALKVIAGFASGSRLAHPNAPEASHLYFSRGVTGLLSSLFATHPPLAERIRRLDPSFDPQTLERASAPSGAAFGGAAAGFAGSPSGVPAVEQIGTPTAAHLDYARALIQRLPEPVFEAAHGAFGARAVIYGLLIDGDPGVRRSQLEHLREHADAGVTRETEGLLPLLSTLGPEIRLPLVDLAVPALRDLTADQYRAFAANVDALAAADGRIHLFEWLLKRILDHHVGPEFETVAAPRVRYSALPAVADACAVVLSLLAHAGGRGEAAARRAFETAAPELDEVRLAFLTADRCNLADFDAALARLSELAPLLQERVLHACAVCVVADREISVPEAELIRAAADAMGCPMPPLLPGQPLV